MRVPRLRTFVWLLVVAGIWWLAFVTTFRTHHGNESNRVALLRIREAIPIGAARSDCLSIYEALRTAELSLISNSAEHWLIRMPLEVGATDWNLIVEFEDDCVVAVKVRTSNSPPPHDGPPDKT